VSKNVCNISDFWHNYQSGRAYGPVVRRGIRIAETGVRFSLGPQNKFMRSRHSNIDYPAVYFRDVFVYLWQGIRGHRFLMGIQLGLIAIAGVFEVISPIYLKKFFDILTTASAPALAAPELLATLFTILGINLSAWFSWRLSAFAGSHYQAGALAALRQQAYKSLLKHSYSFFANNFTGALVQRVGRYARAFERLADRVAFNLIPITVRLVGITIVVYAFVPVLALLILAWTVLYMTINYFYSRWRLKFNLEVAEADSRTTAVLADSITNQNNIEIFGQYAWETQNFRSVTGDQARLTLRNWNVGNWLDAIQAFLIITIEFAVLYFCVRFWSEGVITIGTFVLVQVYILGLGGRLWDFSRIVRDFYESYADATEMVEIMKLPVEIVTTPGASDLKVVAGEVAMESVGFFFNKTREVLRDITVKIRGGEKVALVGPSGAGKTTFVRLLMRYYDPSLGKIKIDGEDIAQVTLESLHKAISSVPQDPLLFHRTLMENIRYGRMEASDDEVTTAARLAHCDEFIDNLPLKYGTYVGERGIKLSGGERQRVAIARAILKNAPILILDEATSSLDSHSEALIQDALDTLMRGKTTIVIAHRLSTISKMDRILVMENGRVTEEGSHTELLAREESLYKKLWTLQAGGFIE
jgi:ATP-binding cassette, subfamily B, bacterial